MGSNGSADIQPASAPGDPGAGILPDERVTGNLDRLARRAFDRRLLRDSPRPIAMALSGGGDSVALTLIADAWAREVGRELLILTVDHGLQADSAAWTEACYGLAHRLGRPFRALAWTGEKPTTGLPATARRARHALLADAARMAGARVVLMGHTADDLREGHAMRAAGSTTPDPRDWAPSPVWPEGRGLFLLRPLLSVPRADLRTWLAARGESWIEDPANADPRYARSRARAADPPAASGQSAPPPLALAAEASEQAGVITLRRAALRAASPDDAQRFVALACVCAGGGERRPATVRIARVAAALLGEPPAVATLAGARIEADAHEVRIFREAGEAARGGLAEMALPAVWDGRFEFSAEGTDQSVRRLSGLARRLPPDQQRALQAFPAKARGAMPAQVRADGSVTCPALIGLPSLVGERLRAAAGLEDHEPA